MRSLELKEVKQVAGGSVVNDIKDAMSGNLSQREKSLAVSSVCAGLVVGGLLPGATLPVLVGLGGFGAYAAYDAGLLSKFIGGNKEETAAA